MTRTATVTPKKKLGQHFLRDMNVAREIADTIDVSAAGMPVLEVGPGMGVLTQFLVEKPHPVYMVEIDEESVAYLRCKFPQWEERIIQDDFLRMHIDRLFDGAQFVLTGNYPYNISSQIFFRMLDNREQIPICTGMIQKEVAERLAAKPGGKQYGILSILIQCWYDVEYLFTVEPHVFDPPPKVQSAVVRMTRNERTSLGCNEKLFKFLVKTVFSQRRKQLRNSLKLINNFVADTLPQSLTTRRPEQLSIEEFVELTNKIEEYGAGNN